MDKRQRYNQKQKSLGRNRCEFWLTLEEKSVLAACLATYRRQVNKISETLDNEQWVTLQEFAFAKNEKQWKVKTRFDDYFGSYGRCYQLEPESAPARYKLSELDDWWDSARHLMTGEDDE